MPDLPSTTAPEDDVSRSAAILEAAGYEIVPLRHPLSGVWHLLAADPFHMLLVSVVRGPAWPDFGGVNAYRHPPTWPPWTRRLIHRWDADAPFPLHMSL
jgi:hypothetical protein